MWRVTFLMLRKSHNCSDNWLETMKGKIQIENFNCQRKDDKYGKYEKCNVRQGRIFIFELYCSVTLGKFKQIIEPLNNVLFVTEHFCSLFNDSHWYFASGKLRAQSNSVKAE